MPKRIEPPPPTPPTIPRDEGKRRLLHMREKAKSMVASGRVSDESADTWSNTTLSYIKQTFGSPNAYTHTFLGQQQMRIVNYGADEDFEPQNAREIQKRINVLDEIIGIIDMESGFAATAQTASSFDFWPLLHPDVVQYAKPRFDAGHFADSVEAAFKHVNSMVKALVKQKSGKELDGAALMQTAFSPNGPIISLDDLSTESGRNVQQGYMQVLAGSMTGIRNPNAHANIHMDANRATHLLFLASLLLKKIDERIS